MRTQLLNDEKGRRGFRLVRFISARLISNETLGEIPHPWSGAAHLAFIDCTTSIGIPQINPSFWQTMSRPVTPSNLDRDAGRYLPRFSADSYEHGLARPLTALFFVIKARLSRRVGSSFYRRGRN
jgi:hypothetical protein